jgi:hypothetical protein
MTALQRAQPFNPKANNSRKKAYKPQNNSILGQIDVKSESQCEAFCALGNLIIL